jgi:ubiquinone/menaquinone biosynthesis C-methylase UbiE
MTVMGPVNRLAIFASQILFSIVTPPLLISHVAKQRWTRSFVSFCFGRAYGDNYQRIIDSFEGRYDLAMAEALRLAERIAAGPVATVVDCGTGTGHAVRQAATIFPQATFLAFDIVNEMLVQARDHSKELPANLFCVQADSFALPLKDESVDLILAQNTIPCFSEFARVCRPGGMLVYADSSSGWIAALAKRMVKRQALFEKVQGKRVDLGFYVLAQKSFC